MSKAEKALVPCKSWSAGAEISVCEQHYSQNKIQIHNSHCEEIYPGQNHYQNNQKNRSCFFLETFKSKEKFW